MGVKIFFWIHLFNLLISISCLSYDLLVLCWLFHRDNMQMSVILICFTIPADNQKITISSVHFVSYDSDWGFILLVASVANWEKEEEEIRKKLQTFCWLCSATCYNYVDLARYNLNRLAPCIFITNCVNYPWKTQCTHNYSKRKTQTQWTHRYTKSKSQNL